MVTRDAEARLSQAEKIQKRCCPWLSECMARRVGVGIKWRNGLAEFRIQVARWNESRLEAKEGRDKDCVLDVFTTSTRSLLLKPRYKGLINQRTGPD